MLAEPALQLFNRFQRDFPLVARPYAEIGRSQGLSEAEVIEICRSGLNRGLISRIGAVLAPRRIGASTLAAMSVPAERLDDIAALVSAQPCVNHNYEREGHLNLWFVVTAPDAPTRRATLAGIEAASGLPVLSMPLLEEYHIDLGFDLLGRPALPRPPAAQPGAPCALPDIERTLLAALQAGLALVPRPYAELGDRAGLSEAMTLETLGGWLDEGLIKRLGVVVRHRELGYTANAMCVWDIPDEQVAEFGRRLAGVDGVSLCYRRQRAGTAWPYNLYCMVHGKWRPQVGALIETQAARLGLDRFPAQILFSRRCFKQCGGHYASPASRS